MDGVDSGCLHLAPHATREQSGCQHRRCTPRGGRARRVARNDLRWKATGCVGSDPREENAVVELSDPRQGS
jgi:hypothetical protein